MKHAFAYWYNYLQIFLVFDCILMIIFNLWILVKQKVYRTWSTTAIIVSCTLMLLSRAACLIFYCLFQSINGRNFLLISSVISDLPAYFCMNITLALIWQWWRIARLLT